MVSSKIDRATRKLVTMATYSVRQWAGDNSPLKHHRGKLLALFLWLTFLLIYSLFAWQSGLSLRQSVYGMAAWLTRNWYGPALFLLLFTLRPLLFIPATPLTLLSGFLFGATAGLLYAVLGLNGSAVVAYAIGRYLGHGILNGTQNGLIRRYTATMRRHSFESVLVMRLLLLPYDLVNYLAGFFKINWTLFLLATIIGSLPGTVSFVLLGSSFGTLDELLSGDVHLNPAALVTSVLLITASLVVSRYLKNRGKRQTATES
jgi:uncharacterized membrane protein YdjX (TVP38/TMEM64 family)